MKRGALLFSMTCLGTPRPKSRPRFVKGRVISTAGNNEKLWRDQIIRELRSLGRTEPPLKVAMIVDAAFWFEAKKPERLGKPHTQRPDKDNLEKLCLDVLTKERVIKDDALVVGGETTKEWQMRGGLRLDVYEAVS
jgi:Holliday junction resolvase RusA-like endonuclease